MSPTPATIRAQLDFALDAAWQAGRITLGYFQTGLTVERKADDSPVTIADRGAEQKLRDLIERSWPDHGIIGEEFGESAVKQQFTWVIDPIDGTKSFVQGVPLYGVLLALLDGSTPIVGIAHFPALNETVYAARGEGCYWNGRRAHVSTVADIGQAVITGSEVLMDDPDKQAAWQRLAQAGYIRRTWGDAYGYALVATGRAEVMLDPVMKVWDCAPFGVILEEAGGTFTDWQGTATVHASDSIATNGRLFDQVMALIKG
jgi:histidinol-phosphatase